MVQLPDSEDVGVFIDDIAVVVSGGLHLRSGRSFGADGQIHANKPAPGRETEIQPTAQSIRGNFIGLPYQAAGNEPAFDGTEHIPETTLIINSTSLPTRRS